MPPRQGYNQRGGQRPNRGPAQRGMGRQQSRQQGRRGFEQNRRSNFGFGFGDYEDALEHIGYYPETNIGLMKTAGTLGETFRQNLGMTASEVEISRDTVEIEFTRAGEVVRESEGIPAERVESRESLANQALTIEVDDGELDIEGDIPVDYTTALIIGDRAVAFRQAERQREILRGESGPVGMAQELPGLGIRSEINEEHFIIGKQRDREVILGVKTNEPESRQTRRILEAKERIVQNVRGQLQAAISAGAHKSLIDGYNKKLKYLQETRPIVFVKEKSLPKEIENSAKKIKTKINGDKDEIRGFVNFDQQSKTVTVARPVRIDPESNGISPESIKVYDGTGMNRQSRYVMGDERSLAPMMQQMLRGLRAPEKAQKPDKTLNIFGPLSANIYRMPSAVPPKF